MKRILMIAGRMHYGGLETMLMNFFRYIDHDKIVFDFMLNYEEPGVYDDEIRSFGGRIYIVPRLHPKNVFRYIAAVNRFFKEHTGEYDIVHGNLTSVGAIYLTIARIHGVRTKIIHAHYADTKGNHFGRLERLMLFPLRFCADWYFACSDLAGKFCFGKNITKKKNYRLIKNGVVLEKFSFDEALREKKRRELGVDGRFTVCTVGRMEPEKNHKFLVDVFSEIAARDKSAHLLIVGDGSLRAETEEYIKEKGLSDRATLTGLRSDVNEILQAADVFVLPSVFEGLPVVGIEAQASGLACVFSDSITRELGICEQARFMPLGAPKSEWAELILSFKGFPRRKTDDVIKAHGYDIREQARRLTDFYMEV